MTVFKRVATLCLVAALCFGAGAARAETPAQRTAAKRAFIQGDTAFKQERFEDALAAFKTGHDLSGKPRFILNIAHCQRKLGRFAEALASYEQFMATETKLADRQVAEQMIAEVRPLLAAQEAERERANRLASAPPPQPSATPLPLPAPALPANGDGLVQASSTDPPLYSRWYFWAGLGAVVVAGVATAVALSGDESARQNGSWGQLRL